MRNFGEADKKKKAGRIRLEPNPANLSKQTLDSLEEQVKAKLKNGYLPCPAAWKIASDAGVPRIAVGAIADQLGHRITDCQIGCFKVDKTPFKEDEATIPSISDDAIKAIKELQQINGLTCEAVFDLARQFKTKPMTVSSHINALGFKVTQCQLGCF